MRSNYKAKVWINASGTCLTLPLSKKSGCKLEGGMLQPRLMTLDPIPSVCFSNAAVKLGVLLCGAYAEILGYFAVQNLVNVDKIVLTASGT